MGINELRRYKGIEIEVNNYGTIGEVVGVIESIECLDIEAYNAERYPQYLSTIQYCAFEDDEKLKFIRVEEGVCVLDDFCFNNCRNLEQIYLPNSIVHIGTQAFGFVNGKLSEKLLVFSKSAKVKEYCKNNSIRIIS